MNREGGYRLTRVVLVGDRADTVAHHRLPDIASVHAWLGATLPVVL